MIGMVQGSPRNAVGPCELMLGTCIYAAGRATRQQLKGRAQGYYWLRAWPSVPFNPSS
jgi:hypothetical protein